MRKFASITLIIGLISLIGCSEDEYTSEPRIRKHPTRPVSSEEWRKTRRTHGFLTQWGALGSGDSEFSWRYGAGFSCGIAVDRSGNVYVADRGNDRIQKFSSDGTLLSKWGTHGSSNGEFSSPVGIAVDDSGDVYVVDANNNRVQKFDSRGTFLTAWDSVGGHGIAVDRAGNVYRADVVNECVQKFTSTGRFLAKWGRQGYGDGQFNSPLDVAIDGSGYVFVTSYHRVQKFTSEGDFLTKWGKVATIDGHFGGEGEGDGEFSHPNGIAADTFGNFYVADSGNHRVQCFDSTGTLIAKFGKHGSNAGEFIWPSGIAVDSYGNIFVVDSGNYRIQKFARIPH